MRYAIEAYAGDSVAGNAQAVDARHAVRDVLAVCPHAEDWQISNERRPLCDGFGYMHLDPGAFGELRVFERLEDASSYFAGIVTAGTSLSLILLAAAFPGEGRIPTPRICS